MSHRVIDQIKERLARHPAMRWEAGDDQLIVHGEDGGFDVRMHVAGSETIVSFDGWHEHFASEADALNCFAFGLTESCRLEVTYRGTFPTSWTLQSLEEGQWVASSTTGMILVPFWRAKTVRHLQNHFISAEGTPGSDASAGTKA